MQDHATPVAYRCGDYTIVPAERRLLRGDTPLDLEAKVLDLIVILVENRERTLDKRALGQLLWGQRPVTDTALSQLVHKARRVLDDDGERQAMIRTVYGRGLQWAAPTDVIATALPESVVAATPDLVEPVAPVQRRRRGRWLFALCAVATLGLLLALLRPQHEPDPALPRLAMLPIDNATGDAGLDWTRHGLPGLIGSLLGESGRIDVGDTLQTAKAWAYTPADARSQADRLRYATGAAILVDGRLRKLNDELFELTLHVDGGDSARSGDVVVSGSQAATLGVDAVPRILRILQREPAAGAAARHHFDGDTYLAQTFARGVDLASHGDWSSAKPYFALCVQNAKDFLPARLRLGEAQANTRDFAESDATLHALVDDARTQDAPAIEAAALIDLAENELRRGDRRAALVLLEQADPLAQRGGDADAQARLALLSAQAQSILKQPALAERSLQRGRDLIQAHQLRQRAPLLHYTEEQMAETRRDFPAQERAARAALAAAEEIGDERAAISETYRLGRMQSWQERPFAAIPLLARAWQRARERQMLDIELVDGVEFVWVLVETGLYDEACSVADTLVADLGRQPNAYWNAITLAARARCRRTRGDTAVGLADYRATWPLVNPREDPTLAALVLQYEALAAFAIEPDALPEIRERSERASATATDAAPYRHSRRLVNALAAAAAGDLAGAHAQLEQEFADPDPDDPQQNELRRVALWIATEKDAAAAAALVTRDFDVATKNDAEVLNLLAQWSERSGDTAMRERAQARRAQLRSGALAAMADVAFTPPARGTSD